MVGQKFWAGDPCPKTAVYGQYSDHDHSYAGPQADRTITKGRLFPASRRGYHFEEKEGIAAGGTDSEPRPAGGGRPYQPPV